MSIPEQKHEANDTSSPFSGKPQSASSGNIIDLRGVDAPKLKGTYSNAKPAPPSAQVRDISIENLLKLEAEIREAASLSELKYLLANDTRKLIVTKQVFIHRSPFSNKPDIIEIVASLAMPDQHAPLMVWLNEAFHQRLSHQRKLSAGLKGQDGPAPGLASGDDHIQFILPAQEAPGGRFPFGHVLYVPLKDRFGKIFAGISFLRDKPFDEREVAFASRIAKTSAHAWLAFGKKPDRNWFAKPVLACLLILALLAMLIPVPLTVLAPVQLVAKAPEIVSAPISGVIETISIAPRSLVKKGDVLFSLEKTELQSRFEIAQKNVALAEAKYLRSSQGAFAASDSRKELVITKAELDIALAEKAQAERRLALVDVIAGTDGVLLYESQENWIGRPVETGERVMRIADPNKIWLQIDLATDDAIILMENAKVNVFLDSMPLQPIAAKLVSQSYEAQKSDRDTLVFPLYANFDLNWQPDQFKDLRIGLRGTAQVYGNKVPLWFFIFRKPLSFLRQFTGL